MEHSKLMRLIVQALESLKIPYMITGSQASAYYGEPRFTRDIDIVAELKMDFYKEGGSEKHLRDITGILKISGDTINRSYISEWAQRLGLTDI